jgi:hypothetical protein
MRSSDIARYKSNDEILLKLQIVDNPPLSAKYLITDRFKFGGKKRKASNSGGCGKAGRRIKRAVRSSKR